MLEETASAIPSSIWASMNSWFTPTVLFLLLNLMIATIAFTSTFPNQKQQQQQQKHSNNNDPNPSNIARSPSSLLHRLKSFNPYASPPQDSSLSSLHHHKQTPDSDASQAAHFFFPSQETADSHAPTQPQQPHFDSEGKGLDSSFDGFGENEAVEEDREQSMDEVYSQLTGAHFNRTTSDTKPASGEIPTKLPAKMRKSASVKSAFGHFVEEDIVEARRPATVRERGSATVAADDGVDAKADDFINRFKQQLKLQRLDSIIRYKDMIGRGR
ncbi:hypothetical protein C2S51_018260 [Perilla frutescens var. frutescens]|nr:hypothetical protein C2S51_018260 [Perilla frutescens var. frutescens]